MAANAVIPEYRLVLIGKTGAGKSATGNSILGKNVFTTSLGMESKTVQTQYAENVISGRRLVVVDTPGFFDTCRGNDYITRELIKIFGYLSPGFHAMIYVMSPDRFTKECIQTKNIFFKVFGADVAQYTIILVTGKDRIETEGGTFTEFISNGNTEFCKFRKLCNNRVVLFNNKAVGEEMKIQMDKLIKIIDTIQEKTGHKCFTNIQFQTMKLYKRIDRSSGKSNIKRARKHLFRKIAEQFGPEHKYAWESDKTRGVKTEENIDTNEVTVKECAEDDEDLDIADDDDGFTIEERHTMDTSSSYLDRLIDFFAKLFRPIFTSLHRPDGHDRAVKGQT